MRVSEAMIVSLRTAWEVRDGEKTYTTVDH